MVSPAAVTGPAFSQWVQISGVQLRRAALS